MQYQMRQNRDGSLRIVDETPKSEDKAFVERFFPHVRRAWICFSRIVACLWLVKGLCSWTSLLSLSSQFGDFTSMPLSTQIMIVFSATVDPLSAIGLWFASAWSGAFWLISAATEAFFLLIFGQTTVFSTFIGIIYGMLMLVYYGLKQRADFAR